MHRYVLSLTWTGNRGPGTTGYRDYDRSVTAVAEGKPSLALSADPTFRGDRSKWNPEELLLAALSECHLLSYLHVAVMHVVVVLEYRDDPVGEMVTEGIGGHFTSVTLRPRVVVADPAHVSLANQIHHEASQACFIASSVNFPVNHEPEARAR